MNKSSQAGLVFGVLGVGLLLAFSKRCTDEIARKDARKEARTEHMSNGESIELIHNIDGIRVYKITAPRSVHYITVTPDGGFNSSAPVEPK